jgi:hypothetical protein
MELTGRIYLQLLVRPAAFYYFKFNQTECREKRPSFKINSPGFDERAVYCYPRKPAANNRGR